jgi:hypothetical protein
MQLNRSLLKDAVDNGLIDEHQAEQLWQFVSERTKDTPHFGFVQVLYYLGGLIAIGAMSLFMTLGFNLFGGWGMFFIALAYAGIGLWLTEFFLKRHLPIPAGIMSTLVVVLTPLAVFGLQTALGWWATEVAYRDYHTQIDWKWLFMELATLACGATVLWRYRLPFSVMPIAVTLWYMSMDLVPFILGDNNTDWALRKLVSLWVGLLMVLLAFWVDIRSRHSKDYAFWLYLFGTMTFWGGLSLMRYDNELNNVLYLGINLAMVATGAILSLRVFAVFGGLGVAGYLSHLAYRVFADSMIFPLILTLVGIGIVFAGVLWQKHERAISLGLRKLLPKPLQELVESRL